jgi:hypothetical protein
MRTFACLTALPHRYQEAIDSWNASHPTLPFQPISGPTFTLNRMGLDMGRVPNMAISDVIQVLLDNRIPVPWIDHAYAYGLHYLDHHHDGQSPFNGHFDDVDDDRITRLETFRVPPIIPEWDGWWTPSGDDLVHIHALHLREEKDDCYCQDNCYDWLQVGEDPYFPDLHNHRPSSYIRNDPPADSKDLAPPPLPTTTEGPPTTSMAGGLLPTLPNLAPHLDSRELDTLSEDRQSPLGLSDPTMGCDMAAWTL